MEILEYEIDNKNAFIAVLIALLIGSGGVAIGTTIGDATETLEGYYVCDVLGVDSTAKYDRLSSTEYRAYPYADSTAGYKDCIDRSTGTKGLWSSLSDYADKLGLDPYELLLESEVEPEPVVLDPVVVDPVVDPVDPEPVVDPVVPEPEPVVEPEPVPVLTYDEAPLMRCGQGGVCYEI